MFKFLKEKIKEATKIFSKKVEEEAPEERIEVKVEEKPKEKIVEVKEEKVEHKKTRDFEEKTEEKELFRGEIKKPEVIEEKEEFKEKKGFFKKFHEVITTKKIDEEKFDELFYELELALLESNVALEVIEKIKEDLKKDLVDSPLKKGKIEETILESLKSSIEGLFEDNKFDLIKKVKEKKPFVIVFVGVNGSGKTTTIAKIAKKLQDNNLSCILVAADTFRAAAIQQLEEHGNKLGIKVIKQEYGADPAAVCYDGIKHAESKKIDVVLIDTAGRLHSNKNLIDEMKKIIRISKPDLKIFVGESITGNDCIEQVRDFNEAIGIDAIILSKLDVDEKGGAAISVSYITGKPIIYYGTGQNYDNLKEFNKEELMKSIGI
ncbi:MAG: signal recognition particle-docking protein FtsY [Candidatus Nanoarchaeia archaeon]|nr:signal recognition particle-docking protein FtsY [Candidatus Nanoarchaeia archaeon]